jgi:diguanylate cyclase (GGDEF)-like protein
MRLGIAARLSAAFAVVAVLAVTANLIAEHGSSVIQTRTVERARALPPVHVQVPQRLPAVTDPVPDHAVLDPAPVLTALKEFDRAVTKRTEIVTSEASAQLRSSSETLQTATAQLVGAARDQAAAPAQVRSLTARVTTYRKQGADLVSDADRRRELLTRYWDQFQRVDSRIKGSLDRTWKIFGRIIARESLVALSRDLDDIRRESARLTPGGSFERNVVDALSRSHEKFAVELEKNAKGLARSQGSEWLDALRAEFQDVVATRTELILTDDHFARGARSLEQGSKEVQGLVRALVADSLASTGASAAVTHTEVIDGSKAEEPGSPQSPGGLEPGQPAPAVIDEVTTTSVPASNNDRMLIALISGAVLVLLLLICVATVRSVTLPIRRMIAMTKRLSAGRGDANVTVERGGISELDTLAVAFNDMAVRLNAAHTQMREYQGKLEERVDERTRQLQHLAEHDPLTGLPNRRQLLTYLQSTLRKAHREGAQVGVFFLDLDNFKNINDSMGHAFGDRVLTAIAERLREATADTGFAARLGGDEFTVVYENAQSIDDVCRVGGTLVYAFEKPLVIDGRDLIVGVSVGASVYPDHEMDGEALLRAADAALFEAKQAGRARLSLFSPAMLEAATLKFRIEQGLRRAVDRGEFELLFQPEVSFDAMETQVVEALLRWRLPDGRNVSPAEFLAVAEESGLITSISDWVLSSAIEAAAKWHRGTWPDVRVAINVSARQLLDARFAERVRGLMEHHRLPARCIEIELTETVLQTGPATVETLRQLRELGVAIALDDFGTGYSSLSSLEQLPLTRVKLDRSLIASIHTSARSLAIARAIIGLCNDLELEVTAEGIESPAQLAVLLDLPPLCLQGYLLAQPVSGDELPAVLSQLPARLQLLLLSLPGRPRLPGPEREEDVAGRLVAEQAVS